MNLFTAFFYFYGQIIAIIRALTTMYRKYIVLTVLILFAMGAFAQKTAKPQLLVYGQGEVAFGAAVQAAKSGVQTLWVNPAAHFESMLTQGTDVKQVTAYQNLDGGLWGEFLKSTINASNYTDSVFKRAKSHLSPRLSQNAFERIIDSAKNLTVVYSTTVRSLKRSRKDWTIELSNGVKHKVFAVVDASADAPILALVEEEDRIADSVKLDLKPIPAQELYQSTTYKTSLMINDRGEGESIIPSSFLISPYANNLFGVYHSVSLMGKSPLTINDVPRLMLLGQALGATAGYCAFFERDYNKINLRTLQGELLAFKALLMPFHDIAFEDVHNVYIQHIGLAGILKGETSGEGEFIFNPDAPVSTAEIEEVMRNIYTRSQIWFNQHSSDQLKVSEVIDLIKFIALKGDEIDRAVESRWNSRFHFKSTFNADASITRREFAVLVDTYLQPFTVKVNKDGKFVY